MNESIEKVTTSEIEAMYGTESLVYAKDFMMSGAIHTTFHYRAFVETLLWHTALSSDKEKYQSFLAKYHSDCPSKFPQMIGYLKSKHIFDRLNIPYVEYRITDVYKKYYKDNTKGKMFVTEKDLESLIYDCMYYFDYNETIKVVKQFKTPAGPVDLMIDHENCAFLVELKKGTAKRKDVYQVLDYQKSFSTEKGTKAIPILIAFDFENDVIELAKQTGVFCYRYFIGFDIPSAMVVLEPSYGSAEFDSFYEHYTQSVGHMESNVKTFSINSMQKYHDTLKECQRAVDWIIAETKNASA